MELGFDSGDPTSGATGTGAISIMLDPSSTYRILTFLLLEYTGAAKMELGKFLVMATLEQQQYLVQELTQVAYGIFEYDVPTGYTALSTKGLNE